MSQRPTAFISFSLEDREQVAPVGEYVHRLGFKPWMNQVAGGETVAATVCDAVWNAEAFIVALSPSALLSSWVRMEIDTAIQRSVETDRERPRILPVQLAPVEVSGWLRTLNFVDVGGLTEAEWKARIREWAELNFGDRLRRPAPARVAGRRRALLVVGGEYLDPRLRRLRAPARGAEELEAVLADPRIGGWDVERLAGGSTAEVKRAITELFGEAGDDDDVLLFICGHDVVSDDRTLYFASSSTHLERLETTGIEDAFVANRMRDTRARATVLILDCARSPGLGGAPAGALVADAQQRFRTDMPAVESRGGRDVRGRVVLTASTELERPFHAGAPIAPPGSFAGLLARGLRTGEADLDRDGSITPEELYAYASQRMQELSPRQTPGIFSQMYGQLAIGRRRERAPDVRPEAYAPPEPYVPPEPEPYVPPEAVEPYVPPEPEPIPPPEPPDLGDPPQVPRGRELKQLPHDGAVRGVAFSPDSDRLATCGDDRLWRVWDLDGERVLLSGAHPWSARLSRELLSVAFSPDGAHLATAGCDATARVWDAGDGRELFHVTHTKWARDVTFSPDGTLVASAGDDRVVRVRSIADQRKVYTIKRNARALHAVAFSPDGTRLAIAGAAGSARVLDLRGSRDAQTAIHGGRVWDVRFSPDGRFLATASDDGSARLWHLDESPGGNLELAVAVHHASAVWAVAFSPDGARFATSGKDGTARIWSIDGGHELLRVEHPGHHVWQVAFSPEGDRLATASGDGTARVWGV